ncbi:MAG: YdcF family protein [Clostridia bacterium]|nr:YdcF family protein [Clostridia bacterium]
MAIALIIIGAVLFVNGLVLSIMSNFNLGVILTVCAGIFFLAWGIFYRKFNKLAEKGIFRIIRIFVIVLLCLEMLFVGFLAVYGDADNVNYDEDVVIVLGAGVRGDRVTLPLKMRLDKAVEYHKRNPEALIVVTGGRGLQETVTEASAMEKYLVDNGVPKHVIIKEEQATSTNENMRFSKVIIDTYFDGGYKTVVITNNFHIYRGVSIAKLEGFENVFHMHAGLQWYNLVPCYIRESLAVLKMWVLG